MASIPKQITIDVAPAQAWAALREFGALHKMASGFVTDTTLDGRDRLVTFFNGQTVRERLIGRDDERRRLAWSIVDGPYAHHNGVAQIFDDNDGGTVFAWTSDILPDEAAPRTAEMMDAGLAAIKRTLEGQG
jgi:hypothetical protein